jgi:hypothetical protein
VNAVSWLRCLAFSVLPLGVAWSAPVVVDGVIDLQVRGRVFCDVGCRCSNAAVRVIDAGVGTGTSKGSQIDRRAVSLGEPFSFRAREYWWSATITDEVPTLGLRVEVSVSAQGCVEKSATIDLNSVPEKEGVFEVDLGEVVLECARGGAKGDGLKGTEEVKPPLQRAPARAAAPEPVRRTVPERLSIPVLRGGLVLAALRQYRDRTPS